MKVVNGEGAVELPRYQCHKIVHALKIRRVGLCSVQEPGEQPKAFIYPEEPGYEPFMVSAEYVRKHNPQPGGYYVVYDDGYESWSPGDAFVKGYTALANQSVEDVGCLALKAARDFIAEELENRKAGFAAEDDDGYIEDTAGTLLIVKAALAAQGGDRG